MAAYKCVALLCVMMCLSSAISEEQTPVKTREGKQMYLVPLDVPAADYYNQPLMSNPYINNPYNMPMDQLQGRSAAGMQKSKYEGHEGHEGHSDYCPIPPLAVITSCGHGIGTVVSAASRGIISYYVERKRKNEHKDEDKPNKPVGVGSTDESSDASDSDAPADPATLRHYYDQDDSHHHQFSSFQYPTFQNPTVNCTYGIAAAPPHSRVRVKCLNISPHIRVTVANSHHSRVLRANQEFTSEHSFLVLNADQSGGLGYYPYPSNRPLPGGFTCIWSTVAKEHHSD